MEKSVNGFPLSSQPRHFWSEIDIYFRNRARSVRQANILWLNLSSGSARFVRNRFSLLRYRIRPLCQGGAASVWFIDGLPGPGLSFPSYHLNNSMTYQNNWRLFARILNNLLSHKTK
jgi:hypothetical protein